MATAHANESAMPLAAAEEIGDHKSHHHSHHHKKKHHHTALIVQTLPPSPKDCCEVCDPFCEDDLKLAILSTVCCWLLLGILPVFVGIAGIYYAKKAKKTKNLVLKKRYSSYSRTISWIGLLLFTIVMTGTVIVLATCGVL